MTKQEKEEHTALIENDEGGGEEEWERVQRLSKQGKRKDEDSKD